MRLKDTEIEVVAEAFQAGRPTIVTLRAWLGAHVDISAVPETANVGDEARTLVRHLVRHNPKKLLSILEVMSKDNGDVAAILASYSASAGSAGSNPAEPWLDKLLFRKFAFLDRVPLRASVKTLVSDERTSAIVVRGESKTGKTFTAELIRHVADRLGHAFAQMSSASAVGASGTVSRILVNLGEKEHDTPAVASPDSHWYNQQCNRILKAASDAPGDRAWIVVDRIGEEGSTTLELCDYLLEAVSTSQTKARLVLLGYPRREAPDTVPPGTVEIEELVRGKVTDQDVQQFLDWLYRDVVQKPLTSEALTQEVRLIVGERNPTSPEFLPATGASMLQRTRDALALVGS